MPKIPLHLVIAGCPSLKTFYQGEVRHWHQLFDAACHVRPAMGISASAWEEAQRFMGPEQASIVVVAMLERFADIRSPGGYLRALTSKAAAGELSCGPMIIADVPAKCGVMFTAVNTLAFGGPIHRVHSCELHAPLDGQAADRVKGVLV